jgi:hypothetical protein
LNLLVFVMADSTAASALSHHQEENRTDADY